MLKQNIWYVYIIECVDGSFYTGASNNVTKRFLAHLSGKGARYTKMHPPYCLRLMIKCDSKGQALSQEYRIKKLSVQQKKELINCRLQSVPVKWFQKKPSGTGSRS